MEEEGAKAEEQAGDLLVDNISELDGRELSAWTGITSVEFLQVGGWSQSVSERMRPERDTRRTDGDDIDEDDDDDDDDDDDLLQLLSCCYDMLCRDLYTRRYHSTDPAHENLSYVLDHADYMAPTRQHELDRTDHAIQGSIYLP